MLVVDEEVGGSEANETFPRASARSSHHQNGCSIGDRLFARPHTPLPCARARWCSLVDQKALVRRESNLRYILSATAGNSSVNEVMGIDVLFAELGDCALGYDTRSCARYSSGGLRMLDRLYKDECRIHLLCLSARAVDTLAESDIWGTFGFLQTPCGGAQP